MKQRHVIAVIVFSIITFGIYDLFWLASTKKVLNERTHVHVPSLWLLFSSLLIFIAAFIVEIIGSMTSGGSAGLSIVVVLAYIIGFLALVIVPVWWFLKYSKAVNEYTNGEISTAVSFILLWILRFIGMAIIQDKFNDMALAGATPSAGAAAPAAATPMAPGAMPAAPVQPSVQATMPQQPVDPTQPQSYEQQTPPPQPPASPNGPLVQ